MQAPVDKKPGCAAYAASPAAVHVLAHSLQIDVIVHFGDVARHVQADFFRVTVQIGVVEMRLVIEQTIVYLPEFSLSAGALRCFGGRQRMRMHFLEGEVAVYEPHAIAEPIKQHLHGRRRLLAVRAFEVAVLHERDGRMLGPEHVVDGVDGPGQVKWAGLGHY